MLTSMISYLSSKKTKNYFTLGPHRTKKLRKMLTLSTANLYLKHLLQKSGLNTASPTGHTAHGALHA